jgi:D-psicose/D-tagatose/L-ribulose 3-epimerase
MRTSFSNIAWGPDEDEAIYPLLLESGVQHLEVAPTRVWSNPAEVDEGEAVRCRKEWERLGFSVSSFQALLFGRADLTLFADAHSRRDCLDYLKKIIQLASWLGAGPLVFGSPKNRLRGPLETGDAMAVAVPFFRELGEFARERGCCVVIEANPVAYGCDFILTVDDAADLVRAVDSPGFGLHLDGGGLRMDGVHIPEVLKNHGRCIRHVHLSEPMLEPAFQEGSILPDLIKELQRAQYKGFIAVEMKRCEPVVETLGKTLKALHRCLATPV